MIDLNEYPQLRLIAWNRGEHACVTEVEALALYEANWRFVDMASMPPHERSLLQRLVAEYGHGVLNV